VLSHIDSYIEWLWIIYFKLIATYFISSNSFISTVQSESLCLRGCFPIARNNKEESSMSLTNRVQLICNLGNEPKVIKTSQGAEFVSLTAATNESYRQKDEWKTHTEWHNLVAFGKVSEHAKKLKKGEQIFVEGKIRSNKWTDKEGGARTAINIVVHSFHPIVSHSNSVKENETVNHNIGSENLAQMYEALAVQESI